MNIIQILSIKNTTFEKKTNIFWNNNNNTSKLVIFVYNYFISNTYNGSSLVPFIYNFFFYLFQSIMMIMIIVIMINVMLCKHYLKEKNLGVPLVLIVLSLLSKKYGF